MNIRPRTRTRFGTGPRRTADDATITASLITQLQAERGYPCVSLLLRTTPAARMTPADAATLARLHAEALGRLRAEGLLQPSERVVDALDRLVHDAVQGPTDRGVALFAGPVNSRAVVLPVEVENRSVVDPTFATRDLVRALHRTPRHVVLVLGGNRAALFDGAGGRLSVPALSGFPLELRDDDGSPRRTEGSLRAVDRALAAYLRERPAPVVIAGTERTVSAFRATSRQLPRFAGAVHGSWEHADLAELAARTRPVLERYLLSRQGEALQLLERRNGQRRAVTGIESSWLAARPRARPARWAPGSRTSPAAPVSPSAPPPTS